MGRPIQNVHTRSLRAPLERVRPWLEACWSGGDQDCFPLDYIPTWRKNPPDVGAGALIPGQTRLGHGPFRFHLSVWDGLVWRVTFSGVLAGWHGFDLVPDGEIGRLTHTIEIDRSLQALLVWFIICPIHDWAVEALFDRLHHALRFDCVPPRTERPMPLRAALTWRLLRLLGRR